MTPSDISQSQRSLLATALKNYSKGLLEEYWSGEHPESEAARLKAMSADTLEVAENILRGLEIEHLDLQDCELIEAAADGACWRLRQKGSVNSVLAASDLERAVTTIAEQVA